MTDKSIKGRSPVLKEIKQLFKGLKPKKMTPKEQKTFDKELKKVNKK